MEGREEGEVEEEQVEMERVPTGDSLSRWSSLLAVGGRWAGGTCCSSSAVLSEEWVCPNSSCRTSSTTFAPETHHTQIHVIIRSEEV